MNKKIAIALIIVSVGFGILLGGVGSFAASQTIFGGASKDCKIAVKEADAMLNIGTDMIGAIGDESYYEMMEVNDALDEMTDRWSRDYEADDIEELFDRCDEDRR